MRRRFRTNFLLTIAALLVFAFVFLQVSRDALSGNDFRSYPYHNSNLTTRPRNPDYNFAIGEGSGPIDHHVRRVSSVKADSIATASSSVLLADWEVLVIVSDDSLLSDSGDDYVCLFQNNATSAARFSWVLQLTNRTAFKCVMPNSVRRLRPFFQPILITRPSLEKYPQWTTQMPELHRWTFLVYESFSTEDDVVLFVKGVNNRQGINRSPSEFNCVFYEASSSANVIAVKTAVTSSAQEVLRCPHPNITERMKISLEIKGDNLVMPSVAYYVPWRSVATAKPKSLLCACTMVYNVAKFLKEWVMYHSKIGIDKFILYDNDSNDDLKSVVQHLNGEGYDVTTLFWVWPKTQEAGFSHGVVYARDSCTWMMYADVDEFVFSPSWSSSTEPSNAMLKSLLPRVPPAGSSQSSNSHRWIGQVSIRCNEFGPSSQRSHPVEGVTQGYTCRRLIEQRHKSIVLLDAVDRSLANVVHHFEIGRNNYRSKTLSIERAVVNHYKYQAWAEFRNKFRRRVSAYVVDWKEKVNPASKDRTPGLGFDPVEPESWAQMFCEDQDERLKMLTQRWFRSSSPTSNGYKMDWQRS